MHLHSSTEVAAEGDDEFAGHDEHSPSPALVLYVPSAHATHELISLRVYPGLHWHAAGSVEPAGEIVLSLQYSQVSELASLYFPAGHA